VPWVRLDEEFARHPKVLAAGPLGMAMQVAALCYCNSYLTDGFVPRSVVAGLLDLEGLGMRMWMGEVAGGGEDATWQLVVSDVLDAGLWEEVHGGYLIHDYHQYQPSKAEVIADREQKREAGRKGGQASARARAQAGAQAGASVESTRIDSRSSGRTSREAIRESTPDTAADLHLQAGAQAPAKQALKQNPSPYPYPLSTSSGSTSSSVTEVDARDAAALAPLRHSLESVRLVVRWDKLGKYQRARIVELIAVHGIPALVAAAQRAWQPNDPPAYANAWLQHWEAIPPPLRVVTEKCAIHQAEKPCRGCAAGGRPQRASARASPSLD
jgi:general stress protein YciG